MLPPTHPLPSPLRANEAGTFAADSVIRRLPEIAHRAIEENDLDTARASLVAELADEIPYTTLSPVDEPEASDADAWAGYVDAYLNTTWLDAPWFFVETYFYRRLLAATGFSQPGPRCGVDPFRQQKNTALDGAIDLADRLGDVLSDFSTLVGASLWANRVDLSLWPAGESAADSRTDAVLAGSADRLLVDDSDMVATMLQSAGTVHIVLDNSGAELVADLALAAAVMTRGGRVVIHAKPHPTFVSDATPSDIATTIRRLGTQDTPSRRIATILATARDEGLLRVNAHRFWVSPLPFWECPGDLVAELSTADLIVVKGDANYRRLLGDLHWEPTTRIEAIVRPPAGLVTLRTPKAEVMAGLSPSVVEAARDADPEWMINGEWGVIQQVPAAQ